MAETTTERTKTGSKCEEGSRQRKARRRRRNREARVIEKIMEKAAERFEDKNFAVSVAEYIRLMQMKREIEEEQPQEVRVTWVEPAEEESATET